MKPATSGRRRMAAALFFGLAAATGCGPKSSSAAPDSRSRDPGPPAADEPGSPRRPVVIAIDREGRVTIDGQPTKDDAITADVRRRAAGGPVTLVADPNVPHGRVVAISDRVRAAGSTDIRYGSGADAAKVSPEEATADDDASPDAPAAALSLPELVVERIGLHIGGGPNDDAAKQPFLRAIEPHTAAFRTCYLQAEEPEKGGTFGVDLLIRREGGQPEVRQPRTGMKGEAFRKCVIQAFEKVRFEKPAKGPTVISYSIRFRLK